jgi:hypothetical protein
VAEALNPKPETKLAATPEAEPLRRRAAGHLGFGALRRPSGRFRVSRVGLAYTLLALAIGGAVAGLILVFVLSGKSSPASETRVAESANWSAWQPSTRNRVATIEQIAKHVQSQYRLAGGQQLAGVIPKVAVVTTTDQEIPISALVIHTGFPLDSPKDLSVGLIRRGAMYIMCGSNSDCTLPGAPTVKRGRLVRREALELALYTFTYAPSVDTVLVFAPPLASSSGTPVRRVVVLHRDEVAPLLERPLASSLKPSKRVTVNDVGEREKAVIDEATQYRFFTVRNTSQLPDGTVSLELYPPSP